MKKTPLSLFVVLLVLSIVLSACDAAPAPTALAQTTDANSVSALISAEGSLLPESFVELSFAQGGLIAEVLVQPGDVVSTGDVLARLTGIEAVQAELAAAQMEQTLASQALNQLNRNAMLSAAQAEKALVDAQKGYDLVSPSWTLGNVENATDLERSLEDYKIADKDYREARDKLDTLLGKDESNRDRKDAQKDFDDEEASLIETYADLQEVLTENDRPLDERSTMLLNAIVALEIARENLSRLDDQNIDPEKLEAAQSRLEVATRHAAAAEEALSLYELRSPIQGIVQSIQHLKAGEIAVPGLSAIYIADTSGWKVETKDLAEVDIARVNLGQNALIKLDAFPGEEFTGKVTAIDPVGVEYLGDMTYRVTITLDNMDERLMWNMTATVAIQ